MSDSSTQNRHLPASERKLQRAREEGQVPRSRDLGHLAAVAVGGAALVLFGPMLADGLRQELGFALRFDAAALAAPGLAGERLTRLTLAFLAVVVPLGGLMLLVATAAALAAGGWLWTLKPVLPDFSKLDPLSGLARLVSKRQSIDALKACGLALAIAFAGGLALHDRAGRFAESLALPLPQAISHAAGLLGEALLAPVAILALFAAVDLPLQRHLHAADLKMSAQEAKQEHKETEGSSEIKSKVRALMRERANRRMLAAVPTANLVVMNPTHYAVALRYDEARMAAPRVVAKGADLMALRIRDSAGLHHVPVLQAPALARALYAHAAIDREIPAALFTAVAGVLAHVYQLQAAMAGAAPQPAPLAEVSVPPELDPHHSGADDASARGAGA